MSVEPASQRRFHCNFKNDIKCSLNLVEPKNLNLHFFKTLQGTSTESLSGVDACNFSAGKSASAWGSNPLPIRFYCASRGHVFKLCIHYKKIENNLKS